MMSSEPGTAIDEASADAPRCSSRGCRAAATRDLRWRNPALHDESRVKHWLACDEHEEHLAEFLARRGFLLGRDELTKLTN